MIVENCYQLTSQLIGNAPAAVILNGLMTRVPHTSYIHFLSSPQQARLGAPMIRPRANLPPK